MFRTIVQSRFWVNVSLAMFLIAVGGCESKSKMDICIEDCKRKTDQRMLKSMGGSCRSLCELQEELYGN